MELRGRRSRSRIRGPLIEEITCRFVDGKIVEATANAGEDVLNRLIATDEGARRLGEVALVPHSFADRADGDSVLEHAVRWRNAASHIALGQAYATCLIDGETMDEAALAARGANTSLIHVDWMIGSAEMDVDGMAEDGTSGAVDAAWGSGSRSNLALSTADPSASLRNANQETVRPYTP